MALCPRCGAIVPVREGQGIVCPACGKIGYRAARTEFGRKPFPWLRVVVIFLLADAAAFVVMWSTGAWP